MRKLFAAALLIILGNRAAAQVYTIPYNNAVVTTDGIINATEWGNAAKNTIPVSATDSVTVWYKHDYNALYFAFAGKLESANTLFPEVLLDPQFVKGASWASGQWWFHVSATDCENNGAYGVYTNCAVTQPGWQGIPNFSPGSPLTDTVELKIPFSKLSINPFLKDTIGMSFVATNTASIFKLFPASADRNKPDTWGKFLIGKWPVSVEAGAYKEVHIYPNPALDKLTITSCTGCTRYSIIDMTGRTLLAGILDNTGLIKVAQLLQGIYTLQLLSNNTCLNYKFVKQ